MIARASSYLSIVLIMKRIHLLVRRAHLQEADRIEVLVVCLESVSKLQTQIDESCAREKEPLFHSFQLHFGVEIGFQSTPEPTSNHVVVTCVEHLTVDITLSHVVSR